MKVVIDTMLPYNGNPRELPAWQVTGNFAKERHYGQPIMARATAVWLVDNTTLTFKQIADFVEMHELEVQGIADGDVAVGVKVWTNANNQLEAVEITKGEADPLHKLKLKFNPSAVGEENVVVRVATVVSVRSSSIYFVVGQIPPRIE